MALVRRKISNKRQNILTVVMIIVILITIIAAYYGIFRKPEVAPIITQEQIEKQALTTPPPQNSGLDALEKFNKTPLVTQLKKFGTWPLSIEPKGKSALFIVPPSE